MWETIKNNPWKVFAGSSGTLIFTVSGFLFTDARYVHTSHMVDSHIAYDLQFQELNDKIKVLEKELKSRN
jgi:hypothetical protein